MGSYFFTVPKISVMVEEADESQYWLEVINDANIKCDSQELYRLLLEAEEILKIVSTARSNSSK